MNKKTKTKSKDKKKEALTKEDFFKALDKVIDVVKPKPKRPAKGKSKTSE
jgi:hypothetical protein